MHRRSNVLLVALLALFLVIFWWVPIEDSKELHQVPVAEGGRSRDQSQARSSRALTDEEALRISPVGWTPPAVFMTEGRPVVSLTFPRGENFNRRFAKPKSRELPVGIAGQAQVILAQMPADERTHLLPEEIDEYTRVGRRLAFSPSALDAVIEGTATEILAPSIDDEVVRLKISRIKTRDTHTHTLFGKVIGEENTSAVQLVYHDGVLSGSIARYRTGQELSYRILADGYLAVREIDQLAMKDVCGVPEVATDQLLENEADGSAPLSEEGEVASDDVNPNNRVLDVVVGYGIDARIAEGGYAAMEALIIGSVDRMNDAFTNSEIEDAEVMLLGTIEDPDYDYPGALSGNMGEELNNLRSTNDGVLDAVSAYRAELGADFVSFVVRSADGSAGIAYRPGRESVTSRTYMTATRITFAHELGHNIGCDHSWGDSTQAYKRDYGWRLDPPNAVRVRTIMAYDWGWGNGHRVPYFANPNVEYNGARTGAVPGYDVLGDATADQRYLAGGLGYDGSNTSLAGFDGSVPGLAAMNAETVATGGGSSSLGMGRASSRTTRSDFNVVSPEAGVRWVASDTEVIYFTGGDREDSADIALYRNGSFVEDIAFSLNAATDRKYEWTIPSGLEPDPNYMIRVTLYRNAGVFTADSGVFEILGDSPQVISHSPSSSSVIVGEVSDLKLTFNRSMNPSSFTISDDVLSFTGPSGENLKSTISGSSWSSGNSILTLNYGTVSQAGEYVLILSSAILDQDGDALDQDKDLQPGEPIDDRYIARFEISDLPNAVDAPEFVWASTGDALWVPQKAVAHDGVDAAQSGSIIDNQTSSLGTSVVGPGVLTFWWKIDSETNYDWLEFYLNGALQSGDVARISGTVDWVEKSVSIPAGVQALQWTYRKDGSVSNGADAAWLDEVTYIPDSAETYVVSFRANGSTGGSPPPNESRLGGLTVSIPGNIGSLSRNGFSFDGWNTAASGNGTHYAPGDNYLVVSNLELFAEWNALPLVNAGEDQVVNLGSGGSWSPAALAPEAWYDAQDGATLISGGSGVSEWRDKSGNGRHAVQSTASAQPVLAPTSMNGKPALLFDGSSSYFDVDLDYLAAVSHSAFVVTKTTGFNNIYGAANPGQGAKSLHMGFRNDLSYRTNYWGNDWYGSISFNFDREGGNVLNFIWKQSTSKEVFSNGWLEGIRQGAGEIDTMAGGGRIGRVTNHGYYGGDIAEMLFYTGDLSGDERELVEGYLAHKWSLVERLPSDHPFKSAGPNGVSVTVDTEGDASDQESDPLTISWSVESGQEGVRFDDSSLIRPMITFTSPGVYVLRLTVTDGLGESFDEVTITVGAQSIYDAWAGEGFVEPFTTQGIMLNPDGDSYVNLQEFAFGMDPTQGDGVALSYAPDGAVVSSGPPVIEDLSSGDASEEFHVVFARRKDYVAADLTYTVEFTADLTRWTASAATPVRLTSAGAAGSMEVVAVPFPATVPLSGGGAESPIFYRVGVATP